ncbi:hypothetical protein [Kitasatospora sp. NBC_01300]|uniref:hypothetical protein n=1 Tax=Kitasatospora sp. NBC_01300 TaxID=2903574 RepID=UPI002F90F674|nr:hypothetical protein OG556_40405 [Kitasatospora sp. NBC_01300]
MTSRLLRMHRRFHTYVYQATRSKDDRRWGGWFWWGVATVLLCVAAWWVTSRVGELLDLGDVGRQRLALFGRLSVLAGTGMWLSTEPEAQSRRAVAVIAGCVFSAAAVLTVVLT